jgi:hypothetical protein
MRTDQTFITRWQYFARSLFYVTSTTVCAVVLKEIIKEYTYGTFSYANVPLINFKQHSIVEKHEYM